MKANDFYVLGNKEEKDIFEELDEAFRDWELGIKKSSDPIVKLQRKTIKKKENLEKPLKLAELPIANPPGVSRPQQKGNFTCQECGEKYTDRTEFIEHAETHNKGLDKNGNGVFLDNEKHKKGTYISW